MSKRTSAKKAVTRLRPRLSATVAADTLSTLDTVKQETGLPNVGVTIDYLVKDWTRLKRLALRDAQPEAV